MGNGPFIDGSPIKMVIFHGYVKQPDGSCQSSMISSGPVGFSHLYDLDASFSATDHPCYGLPGGKKSLGIYVVASDPIGCGCKEFFRAFAWSPPTSSIMFFLEFLVGQPPPSSYWFKFGFKVAVKNHGFPIPQKDFKSIGVRMTRSLPLDQSNRTVAVTKRGGNPPGKGL